MASMVGGCSVVLIQSSNSVCSLNKKSNTILGFFPNPALNFLNSLVADDKKKKIWLLRPMKMSNCLSSILFNRKRHLDF